MQAKRFSLLSRAALTMFAAALLFSSAWAATHQVLHSFNPGGSDGVGPSAGLIVDCRQSLQHNLLWGHLQRGNGVRVIAQRKRWLDGRSAV